jgi:hypothetical protein
MKKNFTFLFSSCLCFCLSAQNPVAILSAAGGATSASYANLKTAFDSINNGYHTGSITIQITGNVTETATAKLDSSGKTNINSSGTSNYTDILIYPIGKWTISGAIAAGSPLIDLNGSDNVTINGLNNGTDSLIITNTTIASTSGTCTIRYINDASSNKLINTTILGNATMTTTTNGGTIYFATGVSTGNDNNVISKCIVRNNPSTAANFPGKQIYLNGTTTNSLVANSGILIDSCYLVNFKSNGVYSNTGVRDLTISNNHLFSTIALASSAVVFAPIWISNSTAGIGENFSVYKNYIGGSEPYCGGAKMVIPLTSVFQTIYLNVATTATSHINGNVIANMAISTTSSTVNHSFIFINGGKVNCGSTLGNKIGSLTDTADLTMTYTSASATNFNAFGAAGATTSPVFDTLRFENNIFAGFKIYNTNTTGASLRIFDPTGATGIFIIRNNTIGSPYVPESIKTYNASNNVFVLLSRNTQTTATMEFVGNTVSNIANSSSGAGNGVIGVQITNATSWRVDSNTFQYFTNNAPNATYVDASVTGIKFRPTTSGREQSVSYNTIRNLTAINPTAKSNVVGLDIGGAAVSTGNNIVFVGNRVHQLNALTSDTATIIGIRTNNLSTSSSYLVANNEVSLGKDSLGNAITVGHAFYGMLRTGGNVQLINNTVLVSGNNVANNTSSYAFFTLDTAGTQIIKNNVFTNLRSFANQNLKRNIAINFWGGITNGVFNNATCNYNLYYAAGTGGTTAYNAGTDYTLTAWQSAAYGQDGNSVSGNPLFTSSTLLSGLSGSAITYGDNTTGVNTDILRNIRTNYLMGCYDALNPLPVKMIYFKGTKLDTKNLLNWATSTEINNKGFAVERSTDGNNFKELAFVLGAVNSNSLLKYQYEDNTNLHQAYYRIKQVDLNGKFEYTNIIVLGELNKEVKTFDVTPNPFNQHTTINYVSNQNCMATISVINTQGVEVFLTTKMLINGANAISLELPIEKGIYFLKLASESGVITQKIVRN